MSNPLSPAKALALVMHDVSRLLRRRVDKAAQTLGLTSAQWRVLAFVSRCEGSNQASMADHMDMEPITLSRHLDRMQAAGMIERRPDPNDRRAHRLFLTETGRTLMDGFRAVTSDVMDDFVEGISEEELATTIDILARMRANLTGKAAEAPSLAPAHAEKAFVQ
jgi:MarR family transcriptional regulator for hemolysin